MLKSKRQTEIVDILKTNNFATVSELSKKLYASCPTIRRDLAILESEGYVKRCHGGAMLQDKNTNPPLRFRSEQSTTEKANICKAASALIQQRAVIMIDGSSTVFHLADNIKKDFDVTVITNGLPIATRLADTGFRIYSTGGRLLKESLAYVGKPAEDALESYNADLLFFSVASLSEDGILSDWSEPEASIRVKMAKRAKKLVLMCDSTKFERTSAFTLFPLSEIDYLTTDKAPSDALIRDFGLKLIASSPAFLYAVTKKSL